ncbi:ATP-binding protein [Actinomyces sp. MRS3W]|uniref:ATP-binding protein n=1 Tax=Actinomyces sp. MRS3W TaxID=2800796 RepID=UPI003966EC2B
MDGPGLPPPGMTIDTMRRVSRLRNPALARIFREAGILKQWDTGVQRVFEQVAEAGLAEPVVEEVQGRVRVTIYMPSHDPAVSKSRHQVKARSTSAGAPSTNVYSVATTPTCPGSVVSVTGMIADQVARDHQPMPRSGRNADANTPPRHHGGQAPGRGPKNLARPQQFPPVSACY